MTYTLWATHVLEVWASRSLVKGTVFPRVEGLHPLWYACIRVGCRHACKLLASISGPKVRKHYVEWVRRKAHKKLVYWLCRWGSRRILYCIKIVKLICWSRVSTLSKSCKVKSDHRIKRYVSTVADRFVPALSRRLTRLSFWCSD